jgi:uncharacterized protein YjbJ (UPF0337 family)
MEGTGTEGGGLGPTPAPESPRTTVATHARQHIHTKKGLNMNWDQMRGQIKQVSGKLKEKWASLTDDDLKLLEGKKDVFLGKLQERAGLEKAEAERQFDAFLASFDQARRM